MPTPTNDPTAGFVAPPGPSDDGETLSRAPSADPPPDRLEPVALPDVPGYELEAELGRGGMGVVYRARQHGLNRAVALKMVLAGSYARPDELIRFLAEAETAARLHHHGIVQVYETGRCGDLPYFAMEYVDGGSLSDRLARSARSSADRTGQKAAGQRAGGPLPPTEAARIALLLAEAVAHAHASGVVHRDLKPSNILLAADGTPKITDFGLAKRLEVGDGLTRTGSVLGTPSYMPPEQARGDLKNVGPTGDVYSLGAVLYEMLAGRPPFRSDNPVDTLSLVLNAPPERPRAANPVIPRDLETICLKCLEKQPGNRYASADALADDLRRFLEGRAIRARRVTATEKLVRWARRNPAVAILLTAVFASLTAGVVVSATFAVRADQNADRADRSAGELAQKVIEVESAQREAVARATDAGTARDAARDAEVESRRRLARQNIMTGTRNLDAGNPPAALLWFHRAWESDPDASNEASHRTRIASLLGQQPELLGVCFHPTRVCEACFSPDGTHVLTCNDVNEAFLWDYANSRLSAPPLRHAARVRHCCYSPDGKTVATASADGTACLWDAKTGTKLHTLRHDGPLTWVEFHPKEPKVLTAAEDKTVRLWDVETGRQLDWSFPADGVVEYAGFSPDGSRLVVTRKPGSARVWSVDLPKPLSPEFPQYVSIDARRYAFNERPWPSFSPDGKAVLTFNNYQLRVWSGVAAEVIAVPEVFVREAHFVGPTDRILANGASGGTVRAAVVAGRAEKKVLLTLPHPRDAGTGIASPDGKLLLTASSGGLIHLWNASTGKPVWTQRCGDFASTVAFSPDGTKCLAASQDGTVRVWEPSRKAAPQYRRDDGRANVIFTNFPDGHRENRSPDGRARVLYGGPNPPTLFPAGAKDGVPLELTPELTAAQFCNDGSRVILSGPKAVAAADARTGKLVRPALAHSGAVRPVHLKRVSRDGTRIALWDDPKTLSVWDLTTGARVFGPARNDDPGPRIFGPPAEDGHVTELALSPDGRRLAAFTQSSGTLTVYDVPTGRQMHHAKWFRGFVHGFGFSADGRRVFVWALDGTARVFDAETGRPVGPALPTGFVPTEREAGAYLLHVDISPDGRHIVAFDRAVPGVRMWDATGGDLLMTVPTPGLTNPSFLWFAADGSHFNLIDDNKRFITLAVPRFDVPTGQVAPLVRLLTGQRIDDTDGLEYVDQTEFSRAPALYRRAWLAWKGKPDDPTAQP
jgi:WD40 repeat protein